MPRECTRGVPLDMASLCGSLSPCASPTHPRECTCQATACTSCLLTRFPYIWQREPMLAVCRACAHLPHAPAWVHKPRDCTRGVPFDTASLHGSWRPHSSAARQRIPHASGWVCKQRGCTRIMQLGMASSHGSESPCSPAAQERISQACTWVYIRHKIARASRLSTPLPYMAA